MQDEVEYHGRDITDDYSVVVQHQTPTKVTFHGAHELFAEDIVRFLPIWNTRCKGAAEGAIGLCSRSRSCSQVFRSTTWPPRVTRV